MSGRLLDFCMATPLTAHQKLATGAHVDAKGKPFHFVPRFRAKPSTGILAAESGERTAVLRSVNRIASRLNIGERGTLDLQESASPKYLSACPHLCHPK